MIQTITHYEHSELVELVDRSIPRCTDCVYDFITSLAIATTGNGAAITVDATLKEFGKAHWYNVTLFHDESMDTAPALCDELDEKGFDQFIRDHISDWTTGMPWLCLLPKQEN